ncbi:MAG: ATPase [Paludibacter sp.]|nr:ATPase [Paludibacter sp.]
MKLIVDSGSTKTNWNLDGHDYFTKGINPFFLAENEINNLISNELANKIEFETISELFFYGAGCTSETSVTMHNTLAKIFSFAKIEVESDLIGAARSILQHSEGIVCILGTGSNSCFYDGNKITQKVPSLGFIIGDEGSGAALGKSLIGNVLKNILSQNIIKKFEEKYSFTTDEIIENIYRRPFPNRFLARFTEFLLENENDPEIDALILNEFQSFFDRNIAKYDFSNYSVNFVGSVAYYFSRQLYQVADYNEFTIGKIVKSPMDGLIEFHK